MLRHAGHARVRANVHAALGQFFLGVGAELGAQFGQNDFSGVDQHDAQHLLINVRIELDRFPQKVVDAGDSLHPGKATPRHHHAEQRCTLLHGALGTGFFQVGDQAIADLDGVAEGLHRQGMILQPWQVEKIGDRA